MSTSEQASPSKVSTNTVKASVARKTPARKSSTSPRTLPTVRAVALPELQSMLEGRQSDNDAFCAAHVCVERLSIDSWRVTPDEMQYARSDFLSALDRNAPVRYTFLKLYIYLEASWATQQHEMPVVEDTCWRACAFLFHFATGGWKE